MINCTYNPPYSIHYTNEGKTSELFEIITSNNIHLNAYAIHNLLTHITRGVSFLFSHNIMHRDIKPENIIVRQHGANPCDWTPFLCDFGFSCTFTSPLSSVRHHREGTQNYRAPEIVLFNQMTAMADIYSLAITFYAIITKQHPYPEFRSKREEREQYESSAKTFHKRLAKNSSLLQYNTLIAPMAHCNPRKRPQPVEIEKQLKYLRP